MPTASATSHPHVLLPWFGCRSTDSTDMTPAGSFSGSHMKLMHRQQQFVEESCMVFDRFFRSIQVSRCNGKESCAKLTGLETPAGSSRWLAHQALKCQVSTATCGRGMRVLLDRFSRYIQVSRRCSYFLHALMHTLFVFILLLAHIEKG